MFKTIDADLLRKLTVIAIQARKVAEGDVMADPTALKALLDDPQVVKHVAGYKESVMTPMQRVKDKYPDAWCYQWGTSAYTVYAARSGPYTGLHLADGSNRNNAWANAARKLETRS